MADSSVSAPSKSHKIELIGKRPVHELLGEGQEIEVNDDLEDLGVLSDMSGHDKETKGPKKVLVTFTLRDVYNINSAEETFKPQLDLTFDWIDDGALKRIPEGEKANYWAGGYALKATPDQLWSPCPCVNNAIEGAESEGDNTDVYILRGRPVISQYLGLSPLLRTPMNLRDFPFDVQELSIHISSFWLSSDLEYVYDGNPDDVEGMLRECVDAAVHKNVEYDLIAVKFLPYEHKYVNYTRYDNQERGYSELCLKFVFARKPAYYLRGLFTVINLVLLVACSSFWLLPSDTGTRFSISTTMLLTLVAFHFVSLGSLPKISYTTRLDIWIIISYALLFLANVENVVMFNLSTYYLGSKTCRLIDMSFFAAYIIVIAISGLWFISPWFGRRDTLHALVNK